LKLYCLVISGTPDVKLFDLDELVNLVDVSSQLPVVDGHNFSFDENDDRYISDAVDLALKEVYD
jgi:hypothetical protein